MGFKAQASTLHNLSIWACIGRTGILHINYWQPKTCNTNLKGIPHILITFYLKQPIFNHKWKHSGADPQIPSPFREIKLEGQDTVGYGTYFFSNSAEVSLESFLAFRQPPN